MSIIVARDDTAGTVSFRNQLGAQFLNNLHASIDDPSTGDITVTDTSRDIAIISGVDHSVFLDDNEQTLGSTPTEVCDNLNVIFQATGASAGEVPVITSNTTINVTEGDTVNYELTADYGVGYEWDDLPAGILSIDGNVRKIVVPPKRGPYLHTLREGRTQAVLSRACYSSVMMITITVVISGYTIKVAIKSYDLSMDLRTITLS